MNVQMCRFANVRIEELAFYSHICIFARMHINTFTFQLKFRHPFTISKGTKTHQPTFIVELEHMAIKGYGEAPAIAYYNIPVEKMAEDLENKKTFVEKYPFH